MLRGGLSIILSSFILHAFLAQPTCQILRRANHVSTVIAGGQDTVGLRVPNHPVALELLRMFGAEIAAPSAIHVRN
ncbi:Sua5/YciO/YrdC/YwlC family protein [Acidithiobacillus sp.]|uniref:L-threonylcarbamoyladenylate synthase n=1 Tax=Acidithiobacillus sp. TaxID=1872118 RepID=UPI00338DF4D2